MTQAQATTRITGVGTVGIPVTDQGRALAFYGGTLGFQTRMDAEFAPGLRWIEVAPVGASTSVALLPVTPDLPVGVDTHIRLVDRRCGGRPRGARRRRRRGRRVPRGAGADVHVPGP